MSKVVATAFAGAGATTVTIGGTYILQQGSRTGNVSDDKSSSEQSEQKTPNLSADLTFKDLTAFEGGKGGSCVSHVFGVLEFTSKGDAIAKDNNITEVDFSSKTSEEVKSCLVVNWEKTNYSSSDSTTKWKGYFRWVWAFSAGDRGLIMFLTTKESSLGLDGSFYYLEKDQEQVDKWSIKKHKKVEDSKTLTKDNLPSAGTNISSSLTDGNNSNWGFLTDQNEIGQFCSGTDTCGTGTATTPSINPFKESWLWTKGESNEGKITDWMNNYDAWFKEIFKGDTVNLDSFTGSWKKSTPSTSTPSTSTPAK